MTVTDLPLTAPERKVSGFRPLKVLHHFRKLIDDKEDTEQVFHIIEATKGKRSHAQAHQFIRSPEGHRFLADSVDIAVMLDDHARWADCGPNTVASHYMVRACRLPVWWRKATSGRRLKTCRATRPSGISTACATRMICSTYLPVMAAMHWAK
jgi:hypothetical protein